MGRAKKRVKTVLLIWENGFDAQEFLKNLVTLFSVKKVIYQVIYYLYIAEKIRL